MSPIKMPVLIFAAQFFGKKKKQQMVCPCHHGKFDVATGNPTAGPPRRPLPAIEVKVEKGAVYAVKVKRYEV